MFCPFCGAEIKNQSKFCSACGKPQNSIKKSSSNNWKIVLRYIFGVVFILGGILPYLQESNSVEYSNYQPSEIAAISSFTHFSSFLSPLFYFSSSVLSIYTGFLLLKREVNPTTPVIFCSIMHLVSMLYSGVINLLIYCFPKVVLSFYTSEASIIAAGEEIIRSEQDILYSYQDNAVRRAIISAILIAISIVFILIRKRHMNNSAAENIKTSTLGNILMILSISLLSVVRTILSTSLAEYSYGNYAVAANSAASFAYSHISSTVFFLFIFILAITVFFNRTKRWILAIPTLSIVIILGFIAILFSSSLLENITVAAEIIHMATDKLRSLIISSVVILIAMFYWFSSVARNKISKGLQITLPILLPIIYVSIELFASLGLHLYSGISYGLIGVALITIIVSLLVRSGKQKGFTEIKGKNNY